MSCGNEKDPKGRESSTGWTDYVLLFRRFPAFTRVTGNCAGENLTVVLGPKSIA